MNFLIFKGKNSKGVVKFWTLLHKVDKISESANMIKDVVDEMFRIAQNVPPKREHPKM